MNQFFNRKRENSFPPRLYEIAADSWAIVQCWEPGYITGTERGRMFERLFCRYCDREVLPLTERPGSRTLCGQRSASGFNHESDAVIALPGFVIHVELKYLSYELNKNELLIFNQKGLDFLASSSSSLRRRPLHRLLLSGRPVSQEARRFALQWGIVIIEPDRLPLLLIHKLAGSCIPGLKARATAMQDQIWTEIPQIVAPLQKRLQRLASIIDAGEPLVGEFRMERVLNAYQLFFGDACWSALDETQPGWLEERYESLQLEKLCMFSGKESNRAMSGRNRKATGPAGLNSNKRFSLKHPF